MKHFHKPMYLPDDARYNLGRTRPPGDEARDQPPGEPAGALTSLLEVRLTAPCFRWLCNEKNNNNRVKLRLHVFYSFYSLNMHLSKTINVFISYLWKSVHNAGIIKTAFIHLKR